MLAQYWSQSQNQEPSSDWTVLCRSWRPWTMGSPSLWPTAWTCPMWSSVSGESQANRLTHTCKQWSQEVARGLLVARRTGRGLATCQQGNRLLVWLCSCVLCMFRRRHVLLSCCNAEASGVSLRLCDTFVLSSVWENEKRRACNLFFRPVYRFTHVVVTQH